MKAKLFIILTIFSLLFVGCDEYLDVAPDERQEVKTLEDVAELVANAYSEGTYHFVEWMTDNVKANNKNLQEPWMRENFMWEPVVSDEAQDTPTFFWSLTYEAISHANQALEMVEQVPNTNDELKNAIIGEALICRAYNHFLLASVFCLHYDETTANRNLGIPYITAPEKQLIVEYERGTLQQTYDLIEADLLQGLPLLSDNFYSGSGKYHFTVNAANAFASRFYLYKEDFQKCIEYSNNLLGGGTLTSNFIRDIDAIYTGTTSEEIGAKYSDPNLTSNLLVVRKESAYVTRGYYGYRPMMDLFLNVFRGSVQNGRDYREYSYEYNMSSALFQPKYVDHFAYNTATTGNPYFINPEIRSEEVVLNRIEAYVMSNQLDKALEDYNVFATLRYADGGQLSSDEIVAFYGGDAQQAMIDLLIDERRKEYFDEPLRWFDIKRFNLTVEHTAVDGETSVLTENDLRKAVQIPEGAIERGIEANPR